VTSRQVAGFDGAEVELACVFTGRRTTLPAAALVTVTARSPEQALACELAARPEALAAAGVRSVTAIGDCLAPGTIAAAVYSGHRYARELDEPIGDRVAFRRALPALDAVT